MKQKRKPGRPRSTDPLSTYVKLRCKPEEKQAWTAAAGGDRAFSEWARNALNTKAARAK